MTAVNQHCQADARGTALVKNRVHGGANRASRVQHVVHQYNHLARHVHRQVLFLHLNVQLRRIAVVAVHGNIHFAHRNAHMLIFLDDVRQALRQRHPAAANAHQHHVFQRHQLLHHLVRHARQGAVHRVARHQLGFRNACLHVHHRRNPPLFSSADFPRVHWGKSAVFCQKESAFPVG